MKPIGSSVNKLKLTAAATIAGMALSMPAIAQDDDSILEEIVVISKVRGAVNVMDTPVAITAVTGAQIEASGIKDVVDLQQNVPGLIVGRSQTATTSNFSIRGIGSTSNNFGVESSVGLYVDGVYRSRQSSMINELVDVEAVEVLRGPQGTLFGKNTAAGAISVRTVAPDTASTDGFVDVSVGDRGYTRFSAAANIPLTDNLAFRGTVFSSQRDGIVDDENFGNDVFNDRDRIGLRAQVAYDNNDDFNLRVILDYSEIDETCCIGTSRVDSLFSRAGVAAGMFIPGPDSVRLSLGNTVFTDFDYGVPLPPNVIQGVSWEDYRTAVNVLPISQNEDRGISLEMNKDIGDMTLTSVSAIREFDTFDFIDIDFTDTLIGERTNEAGQQSFSQELRLAGEFGDSSNWVVGAYYFAQSIDSFTSTVGGAELLPYSDIGLGGQLSAITNGVTAFSQALAAMGIPFPPGASAFPDGTFANDVVNQEHDGYAVFGQVDWSLSDSVIVSLGARFTDETKDINATYTQTNPGTTPPDLDAIGLILTNLAMGILPTDPTPLLAVAQPNEAWGSWTLAPFSPRPNVRDSISDDQVTGTAKVSWFVNDNAMIYASWASGFKAGGTNTDRIFVFFDQVFDAETSESIEIGFKGDLTDRFRVSANYYMTDFEDFQANSFTGTGFNLQNAGDLEIEGFEIEWQWQVFDNTNITGYYARNEGEYISFIGGTCWDATPFHALTPDPGLNPATGACDRSGDSLPYNPEDRFNVSINQIFPMGDNELFIRAEYAHQSEFNTDGDNDPLTLQDDFGILNLRIGMDIPAWNSTVTVWGRNITDERYYNGSFDPPLLDNGRMNSYPSDPATYGVTFRKLWD